MSCLPGCRRFTGRTILVLAIGFIVLTGSYGQDTQPGYQARISFLFNSIISSTDDSVRNRVADTLTFEVGEYLASGLPFEHRLEGLRYLGQIFSADSLIKLVNWNIAFHDGTNRYTCYVVKRDGGEAGIKLLDSRIGLSGLDSDSVICSSEWYGALYYDIIPFSYGGKSLYAVLGLDLNGMFTNGKVVDILSFGNDDEICFGAPVINSGGRIISRKLFTYSSEVTMMLRFDSLNKRIVFDHLSPADPSFTGVYQYYGPDSSYDALELRGGIWWLVEDIDLRNIEVH